MDSTIVDECVFHLEVGLFAGCSSLELNKGILQRLPGLPISYNVTFLDGSELREDDFKVLLFGDRIQAAHIQNVIRSYSYYDGYTV